MQTPYTPSVVAALNIRKAYNAEYAALTAAQRAAHDQMLSRDDEARHLRRVRARAAYMAARPAPKRRRDFAEPPAPNRQYVTMSTTALRDQRLSKTEAVTVGLLAARAGTVGYVDITHAQLGAALGRSRSTSKRAIKTLTDSAAGTDYLTVEILRYANGKARCMRIRPTDKAWPFWHPHRQDPAEPGSGSIIAPPITNPLKGETVDNAEPVDKTPTEALDAMDPGAREALRAIVAETELGKTAIEKADVPREEAIDALIDLLDEGYIRLVQHPTSLAFKLEMTERKKVPQRKRRRAFRP